MMKKRRYSSSSNEEVLLILKRAKEDPLGYHTLCKESCEPCEFCDDVYGNRYALFKHNITHMIIPLIKQITHQCKECLHHFTSVDALESHILKRHKELTTPILDTTVHIKQELPDILQSMVEKQVLVKCEDNISGLVKYITQNGVNSDNVVHNAGNTEQINAKTGDAAIKMKLSDNIELENSESVKDPIVYKVKEERLSPTLIKEPSSPMDDKEPTRHRLLFEEDVEDTLFQDLSNECNVNIDTLCQEVSLDFENALVASDTDDSMDHGDNDGMNNCGDIINNFVNGMNNLDYAKNNSANSKNDEDDPEDIANDFRNVIVKLEINTDNIKNGMHNFNGINNCENGIGDTADGMDNFENGMNNFKHGNHSIKMDLNPHKNNLEEAQQEITYEKSIHYDDLVIPFSWKCKYCQKKFPNRYELLQHEPAHIQTKKKHWSTPLCFLCDRYIVGNYHSLRKHIARVHPGRDPTVNHPAQNCHKCGLKFHNYTKHWKNYHEAYYCGKCCLGFETQVQRDGHECGKFCPTAEITYSTMRLCDLCFSFMKIYMQNRQNYEEVGTKTELGVRQTCDKCNKEFFSVKLVKRRSLRPLMFERKEQKVDATEGLELGGKASVSQATVISRKVTDVGKTKLKSKSLSNKERLLKIQQRLKMIKKYNKH